MWFDLNMAFVPEVALGLRQPVLCLFGNNHFVQPQFGLNTELSHRSCSLETDQHHVLVNHISCSAHKLLLI